MSPREYAGRKTFNSRCGRKPRPSHRKTPIRLWLVCSHSGAAGFIATKLLLTGRWRFLWLPLLSTFRLPLSLAGRRPVSLLSLQSLLLLLRRRLLRLSLHALHSFSWGARFTAGSATRRLTSATLPVFNCTSRRRRAEPLTLVVTLWRILFGLTLAHTWLLGCSRYWYTTTLWLLRRTLEGMWGSFRTSGLTTSGTRLRGSLARFAPGFAAFKGRRRKAFMRSRWRCSSRSSWLWRSLAGFASASAAFGLRRRNAFTRSRWRSCHVWTRSFTASWFSSFKWRRRYTSRAFPSSAGSTAFKGRRRHAPCAFAGHCRRSGPWPRARPAFS